MPSHVERKRRQGEGSCSLVLSKSRNSLCGRDTGRPRPYETPLQKMTGGEIRSNKVRKQKKGGGEIRLKCQGPRYDTYVTVLPQEFLRKRPAKRRTSEGAEGSDGKSLVGGGKRQHPSVLSRSGGGYKNQGLMVDRLVNGRSRRG